MDQIHTIGLYILLVTLMGAPLYAGRIAPEARRELNTYVSHYHSDHALHNIDALIACIRHARTLYPCSQRPLSIDTIDALTAADMIFLDNLAAVAQRYGYAQQGRPFPTLNRHGRALYHEAEYSIQALKNV